VILPVERPFERSSVGVSQSLPRSTLRVSQCTYPECNNDGHSDRDGLTRNQLHPARTHPELHDKGRLDMASSGKKKTTMAKLTRESKLRERRLDKQAKKDARKRASAHGDGETLNAETAEPAGPGSGEPALETAPAALADA
jgi:hypothetical protein